MNSIPKKGSLTFGGYITAVYDARQQAPRGKQLSSLLLTRTCLSAKLNNAS
jgi:hypothetical protein